MERVTGIGGFFFKASDPPKLRRWYTDNLGIDPVPADYDTPPWQTEAGATVFEAFPEDSGMFAPEQRFMLNFRVRDLDAMVAQLRQAGNEVSVEEETYPNGRFAQLADPEGNPIQLWEPAD